LDAARSAFSRRPQLSLDEDTLAHAGALAKRTRLSGAFLIDISRIRPDPSQPRKTFDTNHQAELTGSIERLGILQPITVRYLPTDDIYQIITGERRFQAAKAAGLSALPCWVQTPENKDILVHQIVENWQRSDLHPYDLADALAELRDSNGYSQKELAKLTGKPASEISRFLKLLTINPAAQEQARSDSTGTVSKRHLVAIADLPKEEQPAMVQTVQETRMTATETERIVREKQARADGRKSRGAPLGLHFRYKTSQATVTVAFQRKQVDARDLLQALDEAKRQIKEDEV